MLAIRSSASAAADKCIPNVVPCRIHHTGPTKITKRYWNPSKDEGVSQTAYFRGRKLRGRTVKLPANYQGLVLKMTDRLLPQSTARAPVPRYDEEAEDDTDQEEQEDIPEPVKIAEQVSTFDQIVVWGHDQVPASDDAFVKSVDEWIKFAEAIHGADPTPKHTTSASEDAKKVDG